MTRNHFLALGASFALCFTVACGGDDDDIDTDTGVDVGSDTGSDTTTDATTDTATDAVVVDRLEGNGCTYATATDLTGQAAVDVATAADWTFGHEACIIVSAGTVVTWTGNFTAHPLVGGVTPTTDSENIITVAGPGVGDGTVDVTFATAGDFPYFCEIHVNTMFGVIYVD